MYLSPRDITLMENVYISKANYSDMDVFASSAIGGYHKSGALPLKRRICSMREQILPIKDSPPFLNGFKVKRQHSVIRKCLPLQKGEKCFWCIQGCKIPLAHSHLQVNFKVGRVRVSELPSLFLHF